MSGSDQLKVDLDGLSGFASELRGIIRTLDDSDGWMLQFEGDLGASVVDHALDSFESRWSDGRKKIKDNCESLSKAADTAVEKFKGVDDGLAKELRGNGSST